MFRLNMEHKALPQIHWHDHLIVRATMCHLFGTNPVFPAKGCRGKTGSFVLYLDFADLGLELQTLPMASSTSGSSATKHSRVPRWLVREDSHRCDQHHRHLDRSGLEANRANR